MVVVVVQTLHKRQQNKPVAGSIPLHNWRRTFVSHWILGIEPVIRLSVKLVRVCWNRIAFSDPLSLNFQRVTFYGNKHVEYNDSIVSYCLEEMGLRKAPYS